LGIESEVFPTSGGDAPLCFNLSDALVSNIQLLLVQICEHCYSMENATWDCKQTSSWTTSYLGDNAKIISNTKELRS